MLLEQDVVKQLAKGLQLSLHPYYYELYHSAANVRGPEESSNPQVNQFSIHSSSQCVITGLAVHYFRIVSAANCGAV